jgi:tetratricopeptide (TPR) repeat protein
LVRRCNSIQSSPRALIERASIYLAKRGHDRAIADYTAALALWPKSAADFYGRGEAFRAKNDLDRAIADYSKALRLDSKLAAAYGSRASAYQRKGELDKALPDFNEALKLALSRRFGLAALPDCFPPIGRRFLGSPQPVTD